MSSKAGSLLQRGRQALWESSGNATPSRRTEVEAVVFLKRMVEALVPPILLREPLSVSEIRVLVVENYEEGQRYCAQIFVVDIADVESFAKGPLIGLQKIAGQLTDQWALATVYRELDKRGQESLLVSKVFKGSFVSASAPEGQRKRLLTRQSP